MVQLDKVQGQKGHMVIHEDGSILSSSGELASSESTSQQMLNMLSHSLPVNFNNVAQSEEGQDGTSFGGINNQQTTNGAGPAGGQNQGGQIWKWNRMTVDFGDHSYLTCLSNKRIHVVKRDHSQVETEPANGQ